MQDWDDNKKQDKTLNFFIVGMKDFWFLLEKKHKEIKAVLVWLVIIELMNIGSPFFIKLIFDEIERLTRGESSLKYIVFLVAAMYLFNTGKIYLAKYSLESRFLKVLIWLENYWPAMALRKLLSLSQEFHEGNSTGKKAAKITRGTEQMVNLMVDLRHGMLPLLVYLILNILAVIILDWRLGIIFTFPIPIALYVNLRMWKKYEHVWESWEKDNEKSQGKFIGSILGIKTVQGYVQEKKENDNYAEIRDRMREYDLRASLGVQKYLFFMDWLLASFLALTIGASIWLLLHGQCTMGTIVFIVTTGTATFQNVWHLFQGYTQSLRKLIAVRRLADLVRQNEIIPNKVNGKSVSAYKGNFVVKDLKFKYKSKDKLVLDGLNLKINNGEMVAFVGATGEGKTTILKLIARMYDACEGSVALDGTDIRDYDLHEFRSLFAIVQQGVDIFDISVLDNVRYPYPDATEEEVIRSLRAASFEAVLSDKEKFPKGIHTMVGERGVMLSGGEKQRIGIARAYLALLKGAKILILDEATSDLDIMTELYVRRSIEAFVEEFKQKRSITIIAVAHRLFTVQKSDVIYFIKNGKVAEKGDHERLKQKNGFYAKLIKLQETGDLIE